MAQRLQLHDALKSILGSGNVYFQPPSNLKMAYPAIVYRRDYLESEYADNKLYKNCTRYLVTVISPDPDNDIGKRLMETLPMCAYDRFYAADQLNHDVYKLYF